MIENICLILMQKGYIYKNTNILEQTKIIY